MKSKDEGGERARRREKKRKKLLDPRVVIRDSV